MAFGWAVRLLARDADAPRVPRASSGNHGRRARGHRSRVVGRRGERLACRALGRAGFRVLARNLRTPHGEVDIVASRRGMLFLVEVKTTARVGVTHLERRLGAAQRRRLRLAASWLARRQERPRRVGRLLAEVRLAGPPPRVILRAGRF